MNTIQPLITIGIPTFNRSASLKAYTLPSIENLNYQNYEVIIVDDYSTDETQQLLSEYQNRLQNLQVLLNPGNKGTPFSRNRILENAKGEIIVFMDDDVSLFPNCLEEILKVYTQYPEVMFIWGCVYQCHGSHDRNKPTFGSGSLFSIRSIIADYFQFDTNIRYLKTYVCEEHDFARRVQKGGAKIIKGETVQANHYQAPSQNRPWRSLGGDFNHLYDQMKRENNSIPMYYYSLFLGVILTIQNLFKKHDSGKIVNKHHLHEAVIMFKNILVLIKQKQFLLTVKCFFYAIIDIPVRAKVRSKIELKKSKEFSLLAQSGTTTS
ncbi:MAG: hypothetical protein RLZZ507_3071 [Cyanobacteriota bacterium]|jgi:glycosyltransferase involved in cell wall biosynthesis